MSLNGIRPNPRRVPESFFGTSSEFYSDDTGRIAANGYVRGGGDDAKPMWVQGYYNHHASLADCTNSALLLDAHHLGAASVSFADGHMAAKRWTDSRTARYPEEMAWHEHDYSSPGNPDLAWIKAHARGE